MGKYAEVDAAFQEAERLAIITNDDELADTIAWYREHWDKVPPELLNAILSDDDFFKKAVTVWDNMRYQPKPASEHVALQDSFPTRRSLRAQKRSYRCLIGWSLIAVSILSGAIVIGVNLW